MLRFMFNQSFFSVISIRLCPYCTHGKEKYKCKECGGKGICTHGKQKYFCQDCDGKAYCTHGKDKKTCKECQYNNLKK